MTEQDKANYFNTLTMLQNTLISYIDKLFLSSVNPNSTHPLGAKDCIPALVRLINANDYKLHHKAKAKIKEGIAIALGLISSN